jgi:flagellin
MAVAMRNTQNSTSMLQTAEGSLDEVNNMLVRMKDLATQAADASSSAADQTAMQGEYDALGKELANVMNNTSFGGQKLMMGGTLATAGGISFQIGASTTEKMNLNLATNFGTAATAGSIAEAIKNAAAVFSTPATPGTELTGAGTANTTIDLLSTAINTVADTRSALGAAANRLDHVYNNLANISTNTKNATGRIMDVDFATESSNMTAKQMLMQAGTAMLKQTNQMSSMVMSLLQ